MNQLKGLVLTRRSQIKLFGDGPQISGFLSHMKLFPEVCRFDLVGSPGKAYATDTL